MGTTGCMRTSGAKQSSAFPIGKETKRVKDPNPYDDLPQTSAKTLNLITHIY